MEIMRASSFWRDLKGIIDYFDAENVALRFLNALDETINLIESLGERQEIIYPVEPASRRFWTGETPVPPVSKILPNALA